MSKSKKYDWSDPLNLPTLEVHSIAKHEVLRAYISRYLEVLNLNPRIPSFKINLIDGFSGGGQYSHELTGDLCAGSPTIILDTVRDAEIAINWYKPLSARTLQRVFLGNDHRRNKRRRRIRAKSPPPVENQVRV